MRSCRDRRSQRWMQSLLRLNPACWPTDRDAWGQWGFILMGGGLCWLVFSVARVRFVAVVEQVMVLALTDLWQGPSGSWRLLRWLMFSRAVRTWWDWMDGLFRVVAEDRGILQSPVRQWTVNCPYRGFIHSTVQYSRVWVQPGVLLDGLGTRNRPMSSDLVGYCIGYYLV